jgi:chorismate mutase
VRPAKKGRSTGKRHRDLFQRGEEVFLFMDDAEEELKRLREAIDRVDEVLVKLLNQRAKYAVEIGEIKGVLSLPVYSPEREKEVLRHVEEASRGPLDPPSIRRLFERIIDESRRVERESATKE